MNASARQIAWKPNTGPQTSLVACPAFEVLFGGARGGGKRLAHNTLVPVPLSTDPSGWKRHGDLRAGDEVFSPSGQPVAVVAVTDEVVPDECFEVVFDTGETVVADAGHLWRTMTKVDRVQAMKADPEWRAARRASRPSRAKATPKNAGAQAALTAMNRSRVYDVAPSTGGVRTTVELAGSLTVQGGREINHSIDVTRPLTGSECPSIPAYWLGLWIGDGYSRAPKIGMSEADWPGILPHIAPPSGKHVDTRPSYRTPFITFSFPELAEPLRGLGILGRKRIPPAYLRAGFPTRVALLQGILDTDGTCDARGQIECGFSDRDLAEDLHELVSSLGIKATLRLKEARDQNGRGATHWRIKFLAPFPAFRLPRKLARQKLDGFRPTVTRRFIVAVRPVASVPMRCIQIANPDGLYLVTRSFITTHNTAGMIGDFAIHAGRYGRGAEGLMLRRERVQLLGTIAEADRVYAPLGARWKDSDKTFEFSSGARLQMGYLERDQDADNYQGRNLTRVYVEEMGNFPRHAPLAKLYATLRSAAGVPCRFRATANPGGAGHSWIKSRYIDPAPAGMVPLVEEIRNPLDGSTIKRERVYIPSRVTDNPFLGNDYIANIVLSGAGSPALTRAWLEGDWSAIEGAFFSEWSTARHVVEPFELPAHWTRFRAIDWGYARPFSVGWYAIASEDTRLSDGRVIGRGAIVRYREFYGVRRDMAGQVVPNEGIRMDPPAVAARINAMSAGDTIEYTVIDPATFASQGGQTIAEAFAAHGVHCLPADNTRVAKAGSMSGWANCRTRLHGDGERPTFFVLSTCAEFIRTVPVLQHDRNRAEDLDSDAEDHCFAAGTMVETDEGPRAIETLVGTEGRVLTVGGIYAPYRSARMTKRNASLVRLTFDNGEVISCTPDHRFLVDLNEFCYASSMLGRSALWTRSLSVEQSRSLAESVTTSAERIFRKRGSGCIGLFGKLQTAVSQMGTTSTIETATRLTTRFRIWNACRSLSILACSTAQKVGAAVGNIFEKLALRQRRGTAVMSAGNGIAIITSETSAPSSSGASSLCASNATRNSKHQLFERGKQSSVTRTVERVTCVAVEKLSEPADVYCLTVPSTGVFAINGGILVSNCADEWRYALASRPWLGSAPKSDEPMRDIMQATAFEAFFGRAA
jgi:hypothetical protein